MASLSPMMVPRTGDAKTARTRSTATSGSRGVDHDNRSDHIGAGLPDRHQRQLLKEDSEPATASGEPSYRGGHRIFEEPPSGKGEAAQEVHPEGQDKSSNRRAGSDHVEDLHVRPRTGRGGDEEPWA